MDSVLQVQHELCERIEAMIRAMEGKQLTAEDMAARIQLQTWRQYHADAYRRLVASQPSVHTATEIATTILQAPAETAREALLGLGADFNLDLRITAGRSYVRAPVVSAASMVLLAIAIGQARLSQVTGSILPGAFSILVVIICCWFFCVFGSCCRGRGLSIAALRGRVGSIAFCSLGGSSIALSRFSSLLMTRDAPQSRLLHGCGCCPLSPLC